MMIIIIIILFTIHKHILFTETMELRGMFSTNTTTQNHSQTNIESHVNGNNKKSSSNTLQSMYSNGQIGPDSMCGPESAVEIKLRSSHGFYSRLPSLGKSGSNSRSLNSSMTDSSKQHKDPSETKINSLFDHYKVVNIFLDLLKKFCLFQLKSLN